MKRFASFTAIVVLACTTGTGCSLIDRLFLANFDGPYAHSARHGGHGGGCRDGACQEGCENGACQGAECEGGQCPTNACQDCDSGACHKRHVGPYGGLAKHHLTPEEEAALAGSDYGATGPAGPPTGAVAYPYYTTRGPRDFLAKCPPSVGP
jgi:hypothetical protein